MKKLLFISNAPNDYQNDFYQKLSRYFKIQWLMYEKFIILNNYKWKLKNKGKQIKINYLNNKSILSYINDFNPDLIIIGYIKFFDYLNILKNNKNKKRKIYFHRELPNEGDGAIKKILRNFYFKFLFIYISGIFCIGKKAKNYYQKFHKNCINVPYSIKPYKIKKKNINKINFIFVGQLIKRKSIIEIIEAFKILIQKFPNCNLNIIGTGPFKNLCKKEAKKTNQIKFYNFKNQNFIKKKLFESHVFLQPSKYDGWSVATMQGMNAGLAIIGTSKTNCIFDNIKHKSNGYICEASSNSILKGMLFYCMDKKKLKKHMVKNKIIFDNSLMNAFKSSKEIYKIMLR